MTRLLLRQECFQFEDQWTKGHLDYNKTQSQPPTCCHVQFMLNLAYGSYVIITVMLISVQFALFDIVWISRKSS